MYYPIHVDISNIGITIVGGGRIAFRKCRLFLELGKTVTVVSKEFCAGFEAVSEKLRLIHDCYKEEYITDSSLVIAATNDREVNARIAADCARLQKQVNVADNTGLSSFIMPAYIKRGDLLISVSTGGKSPALSGKIRRELEERYGKAYEEYVNFLGHERHEAKVRRLCRD